MKTCTHCKVLKSVDGFHKKSKSKDGIQNICKECSSKFSRKYYLSHTESHRHVTKLRGRTIRKAIKDFIDTIKIAYGCQLCGEKEPCCLDFHHKENKEFNVSQAYTNMISKERLEKEIKKCIILCANCHRKVHAGILSAEGCAPVTQLAEYSTFNRKVASSTLAGGTCGTL